MECRKDASANGDPSARILSKVRARSNVPWAFIAPQLQTVYKSLERFYVGAVRHAPAVSTSGMEWHLQRIAFDVMGGRDLVPQHLFIAARCARVTVLTGEVPDSGGIRAYALDADRELKESGARPLSEYGPALEAAVRKLSEEAVRAAGAVGNEAASGFCDRLADVLLRDARTRYPAIA